MYPKSSIHRPENVKSDGFFVYIAKTRLASPPLKAKKAYARGASPRAYALFIRIRFRFFCQMARLAYRLRRRGQLGLLGNFIDLFLILAVDIVGKLLV